MDALSFFCWNKPRSLVDIRPAGAFRKGSLEGALSMPADDHANIRDLIPHLRKLEAEKPLHLIDLDGRNTALLLQHMPFEYLEGGYAGFRHWRGHVFEAGPSIHLLGGYTGSGKTILLRHLQSNGHQVIDVEALAHHKGSAFGHASNPQPLHEHFQNQLLAIWLSLDAQLPVWIEEKGPFLGRVGLPDALYQSTLRAPLIHLEVPFQERLEYILRSYGDIEFGTFRSLLRSLEARMGTSNNHKALHFYDTGQKEKCFELLLKYYDRAYERRRRTYGTNNVLTVRHSHQDIGATLQRIESLIKKETLQ